MAVWLALAGRSVTDKVLAIVFPITAFVAAGLEHSIANMYFFPLASARCAADRGRRARQSAAGDRRQPRGGQGAGCVGLGDLFAARRSGLANIDTRTACRSPWHAVVTALSRVTMRVVGVWRFTCIAGKRSPCRPGARAGRRVPCAGRRSAGAPAAIAAASDKYKRLLLSDADPALS